MTLKAKCDRDGHRFTDSAVVGAGIRRSVCGVCGIIGIGLTGDVSVTRVSSRLAHDRGPGRTFGSDRDVDLPVGPVFALSGQR